MKKAFLTITLMVIPMVGLAAGKSHAGASYKHPRYGMAGCGFATLFIQKNEMLPQIGADIINAYCGSTNTSAMTTGTSNCTNSPGDSALLMEQQVFVSSNYGSITREAAQGAGEHLVAFAEVLGCDASAFAALTQTNHGQIFGADSSTALENVKGLIRKGNLSCARV